VSESRFAVVIAARMNSQRLPGKALSEIDGRPNLVNIIERWLRSDRNPRVIVMTTDGADDDPIAEVAQQRNVPVSRGSATNVVESMHKALQTYAPDFQYVARGLADNPLVDVGLADWRLDTLREGAADGLHFAGQEARITYAATTDIYSRTAWDGIVKFSSGSQLEHPGVYVWETPHRFHVALAPLPRAEYMQPIRTELDTSDDLVMIRKVAEAWHFETGRPLYTMPTLWAMQWLASRPDVALINAHVRVKTQARAIWTKGKAWLCPSCENRVGAIVEGDLEVRCTSCGQPQKFYSRKPARRGA
jgi:spore coat polysaccharide biosynthesis protein SpsF (cytidylyltransferase family)